MMQRILPGGESIAWLASHAPDQLFYGIEAEGESICREKPPENPTAAYLE